LLLISVLALVATPGQSQTVMTEDQTVQYLEGMARRLDPVWKENIQGGIDLLPQFRGRSGEVELAWRICATVPMREHGTPTKLVLSPESLAITVYLQQALLAYILGSDDVPSPNALELYALGPVQDLVEQRKKSCTRALDKEPLDLGAVMRQSYFDGWSEQRYKELLAWMAVQPEAGRLADEMAMLIFFAILHEAGHELLGHAQGGYSAGEEYEADQFAADVFEVNRVSPTLALLFLQVFAQGTEAKFLECRLALIAKSDEPSVTMSSFPRQYQQRVERLRQYYIDTYSQSCT
jgi:hypothetical protein